MVLRRDAKKKDQSLASDAGGDDISLMGDDAILDQALALFFSAPTAPVDNHEEWLLRMCGQLMHREATVVSFSEHQAKSNGGPSASTNHKPRKRPPRCRQNTSSKASDESTSPSEGTGVPSSSVS